MCATCGGNGGVGEPCGEDWIWAFYMQSLHKFWSFLFFIHKNFRISSLLWLKVDSSCRYQILGFYPTSNFLSLFTEVDGRTGLDKSSKQEWRNNLNKLRVSVVVYERHSCQVEATLGRKARVEFLTPYVLFEDDLYMILCESLSLFGDRMCKEKKEEWEKFW